MYSNAQQQAYAQAVGTSPINTPVIANRDPNSNDVNYPIGKFWINQTGLTLFYLNTQDNMVTAANPNGFLQSTWLEINASSELKTLSDTANTVVPPSDDVDSPPNNIQLIGAGGITVTSSPLTHALTISASGAVIVETLTANNGGIASPSSGTINVGGGSTIYSTASASTMVLEVVAPAHQLLVGTGITTAAVPIAAGTTNTVLLGHTGADPSFGQVPNGALVNSSVTINSGNNITVTGGSPLSLGGVASVAVTGTTNHAIQLGNASGSLTSASLLTNGQLLIGSVGVDPVAANLTAGTGITITNGAGTISIAANGAVLAETLTGNTGTAVGPTSGNINTLGTGSITIAGNPGTSTLTTQLTGLTNHNVLVGAGTATITNVAPSATSGVPLISQGAGSDPAFGTAVVAGGGTGDTSFTAYAVICGGTTSTGALQNVSGLGNSGQVLTSAGAGALPTWQSVGVTWQTITASQTLVKNNGYICISAGGALSLALPSTASSTIGDTIWVVLDGATSWTITQAASQQIRFSGSQTTAGATGTLASTAAGDTIQLVYQATGKWNVITSIGNLTVT